MALQLLITLPNGMSGNYLKITKPIPDKERKMLECYLNLYKDSSYKDGEPLRRNLFRFQFNIPDVTDLNGDIYELCYTKIKAENLPELSGAIDV